MTLCLCLLRDGGCMSLILISYSALGIISMGALCSESSPLVFAH